MALADFIQALQEEDIVYSEPRQDSIRVFPPEQQTIKTTQLEPEIISEQPKVIKLKMKKKPVESSIQPVFVSSEEKPPETVESKKQQLKLTGRVEKPIVDSSKQEVKASKPNIESSKPKVEPVKEETDDDIFMKTGTESSKKEIWLGYFNQAKNSRKKNPIVDRMKIGRFTITPDNKVLLLPDYDIVGKDPDDVLKDKWF